MFVRRHVRIMHPSRHFLWSTVEARCEDTCTSFGLMWRCSIDSGRGAFSTSKGRRILHSKNKRKGQPFPSNYNFALVRGFGRFSVIKLPPLRVYLSRDRQELRGGN